MSDIEAILKATIQAKVIEAFNSAPEVVEKLVQAALSKEVNEHGAPPTYHDKKMPFMDYLVGEEIRRAVTECVREYVKGNGEGIAALVQESIQKGDFATPLAKTLSDVLSQEYRWSVNLSIGKKE